MALAKEYATLQEIRQEAGVQHLKENDAVTGDANGSNVDFYTNELVVVDGNHDDVLDASDIVVYVNDVVATVSAVVQDTGKITMQTAPANGATVTARYWFSRLNDATVAKVRKEATYYVRRMAGSVYNLDSIVNDDTLPPEFTTAVRLYAGGLLLIQDYGSGADTDETSKDGYKKIAAAKKIIKEFIEEYADDSGSISATTVSSTRDGNVFPRKTDDEDLDISTSDDDEFMRHARC